MPRTPARVTQAEIKRAVAAVLSAGVKVHGVRVDGGVVTVLTEPVAAPFEDPRKRDADDIERKLRGEHGAR